MSASHLRAVAGLTALAALLRFGTLDLQSYWGDEAITVDLLQMRLPAMLDTIPDSESAPPLYYVLAWAWSRLFGDGEVGLRSLSALAGTAAVPVFYAAVAELCNRRIALAVAALAAVSPFLVWYSQEARAYALLSLLGALSLWSFACMLNRPRWRTAVVWALASSLALATHYFAAFLVGAEAVWLLTTRRTRRHTLPAVAGVLAVALALLPIALHQRGLRLADWILNTPLPERGARTVKQLLLGYDSPFETVFMVLAAAIAGAGVVLALRAVIAGDEDRRGIVIALALGAGAIVVPFAFAIVGIDHFDARNLMVGWLLFAIVIAAGLTSPRAGRAGTAALLALCALTTAATVGVAVEPGWQRQDWRGAAAALGPPEARAIVLPNSGLDALLLYRDHTRSIELKSATVREIALLAPIPRSEDRFGIGKPPRPRLLSIPGFRVVERRQTKTYSLIRLRAPAPTEVSTAQLIQAAVAPGDSFIVLVERPPRG